MVAAATLATGAERVAAAAGGRRVGVLDGEPAAHEVFLVVDLGALEVPHAHGVDDDLDAVRLEHLVLVGRLVQHHAVAEARAAAALYVDPQPALGDVLLLLVEDALDLRAGRGSQIDHFGFAPFALVTPS